MLVGELTAALRVDDGPFHAALGRARSALGALSAFAASEGRSAGAQFARGLAGGIDQNAGLVRAAARAAALAAAGSARAALGIHSPSRVAVEIGRQFGAGLSGGIRDMTRSVSDAARQLSGAAPDAAHGALIDALAAARRAAAPERPAPERPAPTRPTVLLLDGKEVARAITDDADRALGARARQLGLGHGG